MLTWQCASDAVSDRIPDLICLAGFVRMKNEMYLEFSSAYLLM